MRRKNITISINVSLVIPLYNNENTMIDQLYRCEGVLQAICNKYEILVGEDNSKDNSKMILKKYFSKNKNYKIIFNKRNLGISNNIKQLYKKAKGQYVILFSVDGAWNPEDIRILITTAFDNSGDIVVGVRNKAIYSPYRRLISFFYNFLPYVFFGIKIYDAGSIKIIKKTVYNSIVPKSKSVFFEAELLLKAIKKGYKVLFCPISFKKRYSSKDFGARFSLVTSSLRDLLLLKINGL